MDNIDHIVITANGMGTRMSKYEVPKFMLPFKGSTIIGHLLYTFPSAIILTHHNILNLPIYKCQPTTSRKKTLEYISGWKNVLILDADIYIPEKINLPGKKDTLYVKDNINAGLYYVKEIDRLLEKMIDDDIVSGMTDFDIINCKTEHLGTAEEYELNYRR